MLLVYFNSKAKSGRILAVYDWAFVFAGGRGRRKKHDVRQEMASI
jgi:hypothetical protein